MANHEAYSSPPVPQPDWQLSGSAEQLQTEEVVMDCLTMLAASVHLDTAIDSFLETLSCFYGAQRALLFRTYDEENTVSCAFSYPSAICSADSCVPLTMFDSWRSAFDFEGTLSLAPGDPRLAPLHPFCDTVPSCALVVPLYTEMALSGFLCVVDPTQQLTAWNVLLAVASLSVVELRKLQLMKQLDYLHHKDPLTDAYNRSSYVSSLAKGYQPAPSTMGVVITSVNGLKAINAVLGNAFGDSVVQQTAEIMKQTLSADVYRIGGDEFLSLHPDLTANAFQACVDALRTAFASNPTYSVSVGAVWSDHEVEIHDLIAQADQQLSANKKATPPISL